MSREILLEAVHDYQGNSTGVYFNGCVFDFDQKRMQGLMGKLEYFNQHSVSIQFCEKYLRVGVTAHMAVPLDWPIAAPVYWLDAGKHVSIVENAGASIRHSKHVENGYDLLIGFIHVLSFDGRELIKASSRDGDTDDPIINLSKYTHQLYGLLVEYFSGQKIKNKESEDESSN